MNHERVNAYILEILECRNKNNHIWDGQRIVKIQENAREKNNVEEFDFAVRSLQDTYNLDVYEAIRLVRNRVKV